MFWLGLCGAFLIGAEPKTSADKGASGKSPAGKSPKAAAKTPAAKTPATKSTDVKTPLVEKPALPFLTLTLVRDPSVQADLDLDRVQTEKVNAAVALVDLPMWRLRDVPLEQCGPQLDGLLVQLRDALKRDLKKSQLDRLDQIILQARGSTVLASSDVALKLKLTDSQVEKIGQVVTELAGEREKLDQDTSSPAAELTKAREKLFKSESTRINNILSSKQEKDLSVLLGKRFDLSRVLQIGCIAPELVDVEAWINSEPLTLKELRGKVVIVHIYAFGCINCIRNLPHYQSWFEKFSPNDITIIGIQTPETDSEKNLELLRRNVKERGIEYPVAFDLRSENWKAWGNNMWPTVYLIDRQGRVRNWWRGELNWQGGHGEEWFRKRIEGVIAEGK